MTVIMSDETREQNDLLSKFVACLHQTQQNIEELARLYKLCVDAEIDMRRHVDAGTGLRLLRIAEGKLLPMPAARLMALPQATVEALATLPKEEQKALLEGGASVWRNGEVKIVSVDDLKSAEARRLVDAAGGRGRLVSPIEQRDRCEPVPSKRDQVIEVRLTYPERLEAHRLAHARGVSVPTLFRNLLREAADA